jgi:hypothetical protein
MLPEVSSSEFSEIKIAHLMKASNNPSHRSPDPPLCVLIGVRPFLSGIRPRSGWVPEEASSAQPLQRSYLSFKGGEGIHVMAGINPGYVNAGLRKSRGGFTLVVGMEKLGVGKSPQPVDRYSVKN